MKQIWKLLTPLKDDHMEDYFKLMIKPFLFTDPKVIGNAIIAFITSIITAVIEYSSSFAITYLGISGIYLGLLLFLLLADVITGVGALKYTKKEKSSKKGRRTIYKTGSYLLFIFAAYSMFKEVDGRVIILSEVLKYFHIFLILHIVFWELFSVDENLKKMNIDLGITGFLRGTYENILNLFKNKTNHKNNNETN